MEKFINVEMKEDENRSVQIEKLKKAIKKNEIYRKMLLRHMNTVTSIEERKVEKREEEKVVEIKEEINPIIDVSTYMHNILLFNSFEDEEDLYDYLKEILPSRNEISNYNQVINTILIRLLIEKNEWVETRFQMRKEKEEESEIRLYDETIEEIQKIIDTILKIRDEKEIEVKEEETKNNLIFLNRGFKICFEEDIEEMQSPEYSLRLSKLLSSIKENTFWYKNYRMFNSNNKKIASIIEVKGFRIRILINRIDKNTYVVIGAFIKKTNWNKEVFQIISSKLNTYEKEKEKIMTLYKEDNENYLRENEEILKNIEEKIKVYGKGGTTK